MIRWEFFLPHPLQPREPSYLPPERHFPAELVCNYVPCGQLRYSGAYRLYQTFGYNTVRLHATLTGSSAVMLV